MIKRIFLYIKPLWENRNKEVSLRACLAIAFSIDFIRNLSHSVYKWEVGASFEGLSLVLGIEAGLIVSLLGLTALQNVQDKKIEADVDKNDRKVSGDVEMQRTKVAHTV